MVVTFKNHEGETQVKTYIGVTKVGLHSIATTFCFIKKMISLLVKMIPCMAIIHFVSDSLNNQYRNRTVVHLIGKFPALCNGIQATWCWLEGCHGKGPCDGVGGSLKKRADNLVKGEAVMRNISKFVTVIELRGLQSELITITPPDVEEVQEIISTWPIVAVKGLMATHTLVPKGDDLYICTEACYKECCYA